MRARFDLMKAGPLKSGAIFLICAAFLLPSGCRKNEAKTVEEKTVNVRIQPVQLSSVHPKLESIGTINAYEEIFISSRIEGLLNSCNVKEGAEVSKGAVLAAIDDIDYRLEVKRTRRPSSRRRLPCETPGREYQRKEALMKEELVTASSFDDISTRRALADADVDRARRRFPLQGKSFQKPGFILPPRFRERKESIRRDYVRNGTPLLTLIQIDPSA